MTVPRFYIILLALTLGCGGPAQQVTPPLAPSGGASGGGPTPVPAPAPAPAPPSPAVARSVHVALGIPVDADGSDDTLLDRGELVISYNHRLNAPNWVAWHLDRNDLGTAKRSSGFRTDPALPRAFYPVRDDDYAHSGYDRGHLCPSADRTRSAEANRATFVLSNVHPQLHELNAGPWEKLESYERELARSGKELFIVAGGVFAPDPIRIGKSPEPSRRIAVPIASYKIIVVLEPGQRAADVTDETPVIAVLMPNRSDLGARGYREFARTIRELEQTTGYDFDGNVPRPVQDVFETRPPNYP